MRVFVSAGEPSGDIHGANLVRALRQAHPGIEVVGFGGERMAAAGCRLIYPLCDLAVMGLGAIVTNLPNYYRILGLARDEFRQRKPDALILIDYPGFHWWLAGCAKKHGVPVSYFVPPQLWAWAGWRVHKMRRLTDQVLSSLPFEHDWFLARGVESEYIGHPYFDELARQRLDGEFIGDQRRRPGTVIALLPGSRHSEMKKSLRTLTVTASKIHARRPDTRFLVACLKAKHAEDLRPLYAATGLPIEVHSGRTPEIVHLAHSCVSVSGSVSLELLYREKPSAMFYHMHPVTLWVALRSFDLDTITLVNILAKRRLFAEYVASTRGKTVTSRADRAMADLPDLLAADVLRWLNDRGKYERLCGELAALKRTVAMPGACDRAATAVLRLASRGGRQAA
jgi:lipid-A-disaccharide synthase